MFQGKSHTKKINMKFLTILFAAIMIPGMAFAQHGNTQEGQMSFGIKGGLNVYNINNEDNTGYDSRVGIHIGVFGHSHVNPHLAIQPEMVYSSQGARYTDDIGDTYYYHLDYINIPVIFQYMFDNGFRLQAGPQLGILVRATSVLEGSSVDLNDTKAIDISLSLGASYVVPATGFGADVRYNLGLSNINKDNGPASTNRGFQLGVFYIFGYK
jgi:hypothetical protein